MHRQGARVSYGDLRRGGGSGRGAAPAARGDRSVIDRTLVRIGRVIGKPPGWERIVRSIAPPQRYANGDLDLVEQPEGYVFPVDRGTLIGWSIHFFGAYEAEVRDA